MVFIDFSNEHLKLRWADRIRSEAQAALREKFQPAIQGEIATGHRNVAYKLAAMVPCPEVRAEMTQLATTWVPPIRARPAVEPTETGKRYYPPDGYYESEPCTCDEACDNSLAGCCDCHACRDYHFDNEW